MATRRTDLVESMAIAGAVACLAHCVALPILVAALPAVGTVLPVPASFHLLLLLFAVPTTLLALGAGYRDHGSPAALAAGMCGLALLALGILRYGETPGEVPVTIAGSLVITAAHLSNWRARRRAA